MVKQSNSRRATILHYPTVAPELHWNILHLFAGGYGGWTQAAEWLQSQNIGFVMDRQVFVDCDPSVIKAGALNHDALVVKAPLEPHPDFEPTMRVMVKRWNRGWVRFHSWYRPTRGN